GVLCVGLLAALIGGALACRGLAQDPQSSQPSVTAAGKAASDEEFIRRLSLDLRSREPTPAEVHFFVANKDSGKRQKLIDLFIQERQARQEAEKKKEEGKPIELTKKFEKGKTFYQTMTTQTKQTMEVMGSEIVQNQQQTVFFSWPPDKQHADNSTVKPKI